MPTSTSLVEAQQLVETLASLRGHHRRRLYTLADALDIAKVRGRQELAHVVLRFLVHFRDAHGKDCSKCADELENVTRQASTSGIELPTS